MPAPSLAPWGIGLQDKQEGGFVASRGYDAGRSSWGGSAGYTDEERRRLDAQRAAVEGRSANQLDQGAANESRAQQADALALMRAAARNTDPNQTAAGRQMNAGLARVLAANQSAAAGARGAAGLALAQQQSAANTANAMQQTSADAGAAAAAERNAAMQAYGGMATGMRGQDLSAAQANAELEARQRALNDARAMGYEGLRLQNTQGQAGMNRAQQEMQFQAEMQRQQLEAQRAGQNARTEMNWFDRWMGAANSGLAGIASDVRTKEGVTMLAPSPLARALVQPTPVEGAPDRPDWWKTPPKSVLGVEKNYRQVRTGGGADMFSPEAMQEQEDERRANNPNAWAPGSEDDRPARAQPQPGGTPAAAPEEPSVGASFLAGFSRGLVPSEARLRAEEAQANREAAATRERLMYSPPALKQYLPMPSAGAVPMGTTGTEWMQPATHQNAALSYQRSAGSNPLMYSPPEMKDFAPENTEADRAALAAGIEDAVVRENYPTRAAIEIDEPTPVLDARGNMTPEWEAEVRAMMARKPDRGGAAPAPSPLARAMNPAMEAHLASTAPARYRYKPQFASMAGANKGENVGPASAQEMAKNPVGATMIEREPETGLLGINKDKALKTTMSAVSYVNSKVNNLARALAPRRERAPARPDVVYESARETLGPDLLYSRLPDGRVVAEPAPPHLRRW